MLFSRTKRYLRIILTLFVCIIPGVLFAQCDATGTYIGNYEIAIVKLQTFNIGTNTMEDVFDTTTFGKTGSEAVAASCPYKITPPMLGEVNYKYDFDLDNPPNGLTPRLIDPEGSNTVGGPNHYSTQEIVSRGRYNIFSNAMCLIQITVTNSMFKVFCKVMHQMAPIAKILIILYIMFYGASIAIGSQKGQLTKGSSAIIPRVIVVMLVYSFSTNADLVYFWIFDNAMSFLDAFSQLIVDVIPAYEYNVDPLTGELKKELYSANHPNPSLFEIMDHIFEVLVGTDFFLTTVSLAIVITSATWGLGIGVSIMVLVGLASMLKTFIQVFTNYITAIISLIFALMFTPLFIVLALFETTKGIFESWLSSVIASMMQASIILMFILVIGTAQDIGPMLKYLKDSSHFNPEGTYKLDLSPIYEITRVGPKFENAKTGAGPECRRPNAFPNYADTDIDTCFLVCDDALVINSGEAGLAPTDCTAPNLRRLLSLTAAFSIALFLLSAISSSFLGRIPELAKHLGTWNNHPSLPILTGSNKTQESHEGGVDSHNEQLNRNQSVYGPSGILQSIGGEIRDLSLGAGETLLDSTRAYSPASLAKAGIVGTYKMAKRGLVGGGAAVVSGTAAATSLSGEAATTRRSGSDGTGGGGGIVGGGGGGGTTRRDSASSINPMSSGETRRRSGHQQHDVDNTNRNRSKDDYEAMFDLSGEDAIILRKDGFSNIEITRILAERKEEARANKPSSSGNRDVEIEGTPSEAEFRLISKDQDAKEALGEALQKRYTRADIRRLVKDDKKDKS
jgi:hypothetical protein